MRIAKFLMFLILSGSILTIITGCGTSPLQVIESKKTLSVEDGKLVIIYTFNQPVNRRTVIPNSTFIVSTDSLKEVPGTIEFIDDRTVKFTSSIPAEEALSTNGGKINVRLVGRSPFKEWIADMKGNPLDGDNDGSSGGDYYAHYSFNM